MTNRDRVVSWLRVALGATGVVNMAVGAWAELAPHGWYSTFPGLGHHWVSAVGPYDEHLVRDVGAALLALGLLMLWTALAPRAGLLRPAMVSTLVFAVPHLAYHVTAWEHMGTGDNIVNVAVLLLVVVVPAALLWTTRSGGTRLAAAGAAGTARIAALPAGERSATVRYAERYSRRRFGTVPAALVPLSHHPALLRGQVAMERALDRSDQVDARLKALGATRAAQITGGEGSGGAELGQLEKLVLEYADALSATPSEISDELFARMKQHFDDAQLVELTSAIAFESYRSRFYRAFGIGAQGFAASARPAVASSTVT
jgi:alkylhydroperoxidase family enzyme